MKLGDNLNRNTIGDAEGLWESLTKIYDLQGSLVNLEVSLSSIIPDDVSELSVKHLGALRSTDETVRAEQIFFNEVLILAITQSTPKDFTTDTPETVWDNQLDISVTARDLKTVLGMASLLQAKSSQYDETLMNVRMKMPFAKDKAIHYCTLDFGHLYRFGKIDYYLFIIDPPDASQEAIDSLRFNDLLYILSLNQIMKENYRLFSIKHDQLMELEKQTQTHLTELPTLKHETDSIILAIRKDHGQELSKEASGIQKTLQKFPEQMKQNLLRYDTLIGNIKLLKNNLFVEDYMKFQEYNNNIQDRVKTSKEIFDRISTSLVEYSNEISDLLTKLEQPYDKPLGRPQVYTPSTTADEHMGIDKSPYKMMKQKFDTKTIGRPEFLETIPLEWCSSYIMIEQKPRRSLKIFSELVRNRFLGLCITGDDREAIIEQYQLKETPIYEINTKPDEFSIPPVLSRISHLINEFVSNNYHSIVHLDGFEYLIQSNDLNRVLKFNNNIKEAIVLNDSILIFSMNGSILPEEELARFLENSINISECEVEFEDII
ncbi:DUF835 domain-containing protein [[Eubacterium] cellulosolvens]